MCDIDHGQELPMLYSSDEEKGKFTAELLQLCRRHRLEQAFDLYQLADYIRDCLTEVAVNTETLTAMATKPHACHNRGLCQGCGL